MSVYQALQDQVNEDPDHVAAECTRLLDENPDDALALFLLGHVYAMAERFGLAANIFRRVVEMQPKKAVAWNNLGMSLHGIKSPGALDAFTRAWQLDSKAPYAANIASAHLEQCRWKDALKWAEKAIALDDSVKGAHITHGMASLALGDWRKGWAGFNRSLGGKFRKAKQFNGEPVWDGSKGKTVVVYGEQGIGDEVMYASVIPDLSKDCNVILECDPRLEGLFRRSFPDIQVYGTRRLDAYWTDQPIDANCAIAALPMYYRNEDAAFPGTPYLTADPERRLQWRALFDSWGKRPKIGIAWSGGSRHNRPKERAMGLEAFRPLIEGLDADFVSLQYKDPTEEIEASGLPVRHFKRACQTDDYDDTAALVAELDMVIGVHTSVHHLAGALGVKSLILVPEKTLWVYAGDKIAWYAGATLFKQSKGEPWQQTVKRMMDDPDFRGIRRT
jgi:hypothetical protein